MLDLPRLHVHYIMCGSFPPNPINIIRGQTQPQEGAKMPVLARSQTGSLMGIVMTVLMLSIDAMAAPAKSTGECEIGSYFFPQASLKTYSE